MAFFGYFLLLLAESYPPETIKKEGSWTAESYLHKYSPPLRSQCSHRLWQSVPHGRASGFFNCPRSGSVSRNTLIPCFGGIQDAALAHKRGSLETSGFNYWQKVTRRRQQKREGSWTAESCLHKYSPPLRSQCSHCLRRSVPHGRASGFFNCPRSGSVVGETATPLLRQDSGCNSCAQRRKS